MTLNEILDKAPIGNKEIGESIVVTCTKLQRYDKILCSVSGGSDSDVMLDLCQQFDEANRIHYVFFDTGLEFKATKDHIKDLEEKYGIEIETVRPQKPIPTCCKEFGQPFLSKQVSEWIARLQSHGFQWEEKPLEELIIEYPKCKAALRWWCNDYPSLENGSNSRFNINYNQYLKEFMIENPPTFKISNKCCLYAKKKLAHDIKKRDNYDLSIYGVRKSEGGARASAYKTCFSSNEETCDEYRPIFWYKNETKKLYEEHYDIKHSKCYSEYGMKRTGCAGCPFGRDFEEELDIMQKHEPNMYKAANNIFYDAYEYTRKYRNYVRLHKSNDNKD